MKKWTKEIDDFLRAHCPCSDKKELLKLVNETFNTNFSYQALTTNLSTKRIQTGIKPWQQKCGCFRGRQPRPVGAETEKKGYVVVKVAMPNIWKLKQVFIWEQAHKKELTKSECVIFLDGNTRNFNLENLEVLPRNLMSVLNNLRAPTDTAETIKTKILIAKLKVARLDAAEKMGFCLGSKNHRYLKQDQKRHYEENKKNPDWVKKRRLQGRESARKRYAELKQDPVKYFEYLKKQRERRKTK